MPPTRPRRKTSGAAAKSRGAAAKSAGAAAKSAGAAPKTPKTTLGARKSGQKVVEPSQKAVKAGQKVVIGEVKMGKALPAWRPVERTQFLIDNVGGVNKLARTLGVSASQPSRWKSGEEVPSPEIASKLLDLEHVMALAMQAWDPAVVMDWMRTANGFLDGARPIDVLTQRGSSEVIEALEATISGAYA